MKIFTKALNFKVPFQQCVQIVNTKDMLTCKLIFHAFSTQCWFHTLDPTCQDLSWSHCTLTCTHQSSMLALICKTQVYPWVFLELLCKSKFKKNSFNHVNKVCAHKKMLQHRVSKVAIFHQIANGESSCSDSDSTGSLITNPTWIFLSAVKTWTRVSSA